MSERKHTPGPWRMDHDGTNWVVVTDDYPEMVDVWGFNGMPAVEAVANARLIAAAPELLDSAQLALSIAESWIHDQLEGTSDFESAMQSLDPVRAAIAKALGESK